MAWLIILPSAAFVAVVAWLIYAYNALVKLRALGRNAWSDIDVQLRRRHDLVPTLVDTVKGYMAHEKDTLERVTIARSQAASSSSIAERGRAEGQLGGALRQLFAVAEGYPELKATQNFLELQRALVEVEDTLQQARRYYNAVVRDYNIRREVFPSSLVAAFFDFQPIEYFAAEEDEREAVGVRFGSEGAA